MKDREKIPLLDDGTRWCQGIVEVNDKNELLVIGDVIDPNTQSKTHKIKIIIDPLNSKGKLTDKNMQLYDFLGTKIGQIVDFHFKVNPKEDTVTVGYRNRSGEVTIEDFPGLRIAFED